MRIAALCVGLSAVALAAWSMAQENLPQAGGPAAAPATDARHYSYAIGLDLGGRFQSNGIALDVESLAAGLRDALQSAKPRYSQQVCAAAIQQLMQMEREAMNKELAQYQLRNQQFLAQNRSAEGVQQTNTGLQFKVLKAGTGASPKETDVVRVHYQGSLIDGTEFDSSYRRGEPATFPVNRVIPGWTEALKMMKVGGKWQLFIPSELAYKDQPPTDQIPPHSTLVFEVELLGIGAQ